MGQGIDLREDSSIGSTTRDSVLTTITSKCFMRLCPSPTAPEPMIVEPFQSVYWFSRQAMMRREGRLVEWISSILPMMRSVPLSSAQKVISIQLLKPFHECIAGSPLEPRDVASECRANQIGSSRESSNGLAYRCTHR